MKRDVASYVGSSTDLSLKSRLFLSHSWQVGFIVVVVSFVWFDPEMTVVSFNDGACWVSFMLLSLSTCFIFSVYCYDYSLNIPSDSDRQRLKKEMKRSWLFGNDQQSSDIRTSWQYRPKPSRNSDSLRMTDTTFHLPSGSPWNFPLRWGVFQSTQQEWKIRLQTSRSFRWSVGPTFRPRLSSLSRAPSAPSDRIKCPHKRGSALNSLDNLWAKASRAEAWRARSFTGTGKWEITPVSWWRQVPLFPLVLNTQQYNKRSSAS